ncbi:MAG TPA: hypothetical protein VFB36_05990 [Nevskiaceae bacterium]|nr:hypothetical protein [Nevskiaceae bacterium]
MIRFDSRALGAALALLSIPFAAHASTPSSGTLTDTSGPVEYDAGPFATPNPTPEPSGELDSGPECDKPTQDCDFFQLTVQLPDGYMTTYPNAHVQITESWTDAGTGQSDYDLFVYRGADIVPTGPEQPYAQGGGTDNPEVASFFATSGTNVYTVVANPFTPTGETVHVKIEFLPGNPGAVGNPLLGEPDAVSPGLPRYQNFYPPDGSPGNSTQGEYNIGFDPKTGRILNMNSGPIVRLTPPELLDPAMPEACEGLWEDVSSTVTDTGVDPILWTDQATGRTFASNSTAGANAVYAYSDDDGDSWIPLAAGPPDASTDHETIGSGPYPEGSPFAAIAAAAGYPNAVYYCAQTGTGPAFCQRSDTGGASYGQGVEIYDGNGDHCGGLHGHVRVAPDGTAYVPAPHCGGQVGGVLSTDAGQSWTQFVIPNSKEESPDGSDPSIGIATDGTAYFCYINTEDDEGTVHHAHVAVSHDRGQTWINDFDLGAAKGIENADFPNAWAGDPDRAVCGFVGTDRKGNSKALDFPGLWYAFMAHTYDGGKTWVTVNASPHDPVQGAGGIWNQGGGEENRNQLDFNEITADDKGRALYGYDDGCVSRACILKPESNNDFVGYMRVARQIGGKGLFAANDVAEPVAPKAACLSGSRDQFASYLEWRVPDSGGAQISGYKIYRGTSADTIGTTPVGETGAKAHFIDKTADASVADYFYKIVAVNAAGEGVASNIVDLKVVPKLIEDPCVLPGITVETSPSGNATPSVGAFDLQQLNIAEPSDQDGKLVFTLKVADLSSVPPATRWSIRFSTDTAPPNGDDSYFVMMTTEQGAPQFVWGSSGSAGVGPAGARVYNVAGSLADGSTYNADGTITLVFDKSNIADLATPGHQLKGMITQTRAVLTPANEAIYDTMGGADVYTLKTQCGAINDLPGGDDNTPPPVGVPQSNSRFGGALGFGLLLPLLGLAAWRRRRS